MSGHLILVAVLLAFPACALAYMAARAWAEYRNTRDGGDR